MNSGKYGLAKNRTYEKITSSSYATTSSYALTASYALNAGGGGVNPTTGYIPYNNAGTFADSGLYYDGTNIGIGTTSPAYKLDVNGTGRFYGGSTAGAIFGAGATINLASDSYMLATSTSGKNAGYTANRFSTAEYASFDLITDANISTGWSMQMIPNQTRLDFVDRTTLIPSITILTGSGNVGIGTTTPSQKLEVNGDALIRNAYIGNIAAFGTNYMSFSHISRTGSNDYSLLSDNTGITYLNAKASKSLNFRIDNIDKVIIDSSGNMVIGKTTAANGVLDVNGNTVITGSLSVTGAVSAVSLNILKAGSGSAASFTGTPLTLAITFGTAFTNNSYAVQITGEDPRVWSLQSKSSTGFTINSNSSVALTGPVYWIATPFNS